MQLADHARSHSGGPYALDDLHALPCGCVAAVYRTQPWDTEVVALEARGPHCRYVGHETGRLLGLNTADDGRLGR